MYNDGDPTITKSTESWEGGIGYNSYNGYNGYNTKISTDRDPRRIQSEQIYYQMDIQPQQLLKQQQYLINKWLSPPYERYVCSTITITTQRTQF